MYYPGMVGVMLGMYYPGMVGGIPVGTYYPGMVGRCTTLCICPSYTPRVHHRPTMPAHGYTADHGQGRVHRAKAGYYRTEY